MSGLASLSVLVVDDNRAMRSITSAVLAGLGISKVCEASDGMIGFDKLRTHQIDLVIVDFKMSPMDGIQFTQMVRTHPDSIDPFIPIIMLTGHADRRRVMGARDVGVTEFMVKPITARALTSRIQAMILKPRPFLRTETYFGPDRRRGARDETWSGPCRRREDARPA